MYKGFKVLDGHVHYNCELPPEQMTELMDETGTDIANLAVITCGDRISCLPEALMLKAMYPGRFFLCGDIDQSLYYTDSAGLGKRAAEHARRLMLCGCDGIKLLEGKPQLRKWHPIPDFDDSCWEPFWQYAEKTQLPILWHVNDPECFWDEALVPLWAKTQGWLYDESYINNEAQYAQVLRVLERHRELRVTFAHLFFMSAQLGRLSEILDRFPNVTVDVTPGIELIENLSAQPEEARAFFDRYHDRIIYGTDIGSRFAFNPGKKSFNRRENLRRPELVLDFLLSDGETPVSADGDFIIGRPDFMLRGLGLTGERAEEVLSRNFLRHIGRDAPRGVDRALALDECRRVRSELDGWAQRRPGFEPDHAGVDCAEAYFSK